MSSVLLGFEVGTGAPVEIPIGHMAVTGQSQASGKTTTLEGLVSRLPGARRAVAFLTKRGEGSFRVAIPIQPYFKDRTDWPFVASLLEATASDKLKFQRTEIIKLCQDNAGREGTWSAPVTLAEVMRNAERALAGSKGIAQRVYTELYEYLRMVVPEIERLNYTKTLKLARGLNVMDLTDYDFPLQALVVRSVIEWVNQKTENTIVVIPEAWKFAPKQRRSPVGLAAEEMIRQGAALQNFMWCDSQDLAGVSGVVLRQVTVWLFGVQRDMREVERTLEHIPADTAKPSKADIARLGVGEFIVAFGNELRLVYVQPAWMTAVHAQAIATGEESVESARAIVRDFDLEHATEEGE